MLSAMSSNRKQRRAGNNKNLEALNRTYKEAQIHLKSGEFGKAEKLFREVAHQRPEDHTVQNYLGKACLDAKHTGPAIEALSKAVNLNPYVAEYHRNLGMALKDAGKNAEAIEAFTRALELQRDYADAHFQIAALKRSFPQLEIDVAKLNEKLDVNALSKAYQTIAEILIKKEKTEEAALCLEQVSLLTPHNAGAFAQLGLTHMSVGKPLHAINNLSKAVELEPEKFLYRVYLTNTLYQTRFRRFNKNVKALVMECLNYKGLDYQHMAVSWISLLFLDPGLSGLKPLLEAANYNEFKNALADPASAALLTDPFLVTGVEKLIIPDTKIEIFLTRLRYYWLEQAAEHKKPSEVPPLLAALSRHCFLNEYVFALTGEEQKAADALVSSIQKKSPDTEAPADQFRILIASCYAPMYEWAKGNALETTLLKHRGAMEETIAMQLREPLEEQEIKKTIPALASIADDVSLKVQSQYEQNPYPRWQYIAAINYETDEVLKSIGADKKAMDVLIAGCGTGRHPIMSAVSYPLSKVLAVDLSSSSLAYAIRKAREHNVNNLDFMQADILQLGKLNRQFDIIESVGVLHHMKDPLAGWTVLTDMLKPGGFMRIGLYSEIARTSIVKAREYIADWKLGDSTDAIREARQRIMHLPPEDALHALVETRDFASTSACRDLIFHVQEYRFTLPELKTVLPKLGLQFMRFNFSSPIPLRRYRKLFADSKTGRCDWLNLDNWQALEEKHPETFFGMYQFWAQKTG